MKTDLNFMRISGRFCLLMFSALFFSCGGTGNTEANLTVKPEGAARREMLNRIDSLENIVYTDTFDYRNRTGNMLIKTYAEYIAAFPGDRANAPKFLYKSAAVSRASGDPVSALKNYDEILRRYPQYELAPESAFLLAFTYDEDLNDKDRAKEAYEAVIAQFPDDKWAVQARERLKTIDMSDQELIDSFMKKNNL